MPAEGAARGDFGEAVFTAGVGACQQASGHEGERGEGGKGVVLLAGGEGEETEDEAGPEKEGEGGLVGAGTPHGLRRTTPAGQDRPPGTPVIAQNMGHPDLADVLANGAGQEGNPGENPDGGEQPEEQDGDLSVVVRDAAGEKAGRVLGVPPE